MKVYILTIDYGHGDDGESPQSVHCSLEAAKDAAREMAGSDFEPEWAVKTGLLGVPLYPFARIPDGSEFQVREFEMALPWEIPAVTRQPGISDYEYAAGQFSAARESLLKARAEGERICREACRAYDEAEASLRRYESKPGIPKPEYR